MNMQLIKKTIRKYWGIFVIHLKEALMYRVELFLWSIIDISPLLSMLVLWSTALAGRDNLAGYTQNTLIAYYLSGYIFQDMTGSHFEEDVIREIRSGKISTLFAKPISLKRYLICREIPWRVMTFIFTVSPVLIFTLLFAQEIMPPFTFIHLLTLPIILTMAFLLEVIYSLIIVAIGFIFEEARSLIHLKWMLGWLFSGSMIPFEFMPHWLSIIANYLPFKFRYYIPIQIYFGNIAGISLIFQFIIEFIWLLVMVFILKRLWNITVKQFTAVGN